MRCTILLASVLVACASGGSGGPTGDSSVVPIDVAFDALADARDDTTLDVRTDAISSDVRIDAREVSTPLDAGRDAPSPTDAAQDSIVVVNPDANVPVGWTALGGPLNAMSGATSASLSDLAIDSSGRVVAAFLQELPNSSNSHRCFVYRYENGTWNDLGTPSSGNNDYAPNIITEGNDIYVAFGAWNAGTYTYPVYRWSGSSWALQGTPVTGGINFLLNTAITMYSGQLWLSFTETPDINTPMSAKAYRFGGTTWTLQSTAAPTSNQNVTRPQLIPLGSALYLKTIENGSRMYAYTGGSNFTALGTAGLVDVPSDHSLIEAYGFVGNENRLALAQSAQSTSQSDTFIYLLDYTPQGGWMRWTPAISGFAGSGTYAQLMDVAADTMGNSYVLFSEAETGVSNADSYVFLYRCIRSSGQCARVGGRLDGFSGADTNPQSQGALAIGADNLPVVAWSERASATGAYSILVRKAVP